MTERLKSRERGKRVDDSGGRVGGVRHCELCSDWRSELRFEWMEASTRKRGDD